MEGVVEEVATFKKPAGGGNGKYELKDQYYQEYSPFFYHYSKSDQSKVKEELIVFLFIMYYFLT